MNYKLLMESWRKFLKEEEEKEEEETTGSPYDPMAGDPDMERLRDKMQKYKDDTEGARDYLSKLRTGDGDETFPVVDGKNFLIPIPGVPGSHNGSDFNQPRGPKKKEGGIHAAWDQWVPVGTPVQAPATGVITRTILAGRQMDWASIAFVKKLHSLRKEGVDLGLSSLPPLSIKSWNQLRAWNKKFAPVNALASLIRRRSDLSIPANGMGLILLTDRDQHGNRFKFIFSHMDKVTASAGRVKAGQKLGTTGTTGVFDDPPHLHFEILVHGTLGVVEPLPGSIQNNPGSSKVGQMNPIKVIPGLLGAVRGQGTYAEYEDLL